MKDVKLSEFRMKIYNHEEKQALNKELVIIDFYADWCEPCKVMDNVLSQLEKEFQNVTFIKINAEEEYELTEYFKIKNLPTLIFLDVKGNISTFSGLISKEQLSKKISKFINIEELV